MTELEQYKAMLVNAQIKYDVHMHDDGFISIIIGNVTDGAFWHLFSSNGLLISCGTSA